MHVGCFQASIGRPYYLHRKDIAWAGEGDKGATPPPHPQSSSGSKVLGGGHNHDARTVEWRNIFYYFSACKIILRRITSDLNTGGGVGELPPCPLPPPPTHTHLSYSPGNPFHDQYFLGYPNARHWIHHVAIEVMTLTLYGGPWSGCRPTFDLRREHVWLPTCDRPSCIFFQYLTMNSGFYQILQTSM